MEDLVALDVGEVHIVERDQSGRTRRWWACVWSVFHVRLIENVEHHIEEEEKEMLPDAKKTLGKDIDVLGDQMRVRKEALLAASR